MPTKPPENPQVRNHSKWLYAFLQRLPVAGGCKPSGRISCQGPGTWLKSCQSTASGPSGNGASVAPSTARPKPAKPASRNRSAATRPSGKRTYSACADNCSDNSSAENSSPATLIRGSASTKPMARCSRRTPRKHRRAGPQRVGDGSGGTLTFPSRL